MIKQAPWKSSAIFFVRNILHFAMSDLPLDCCIRRRRQSAFEVDY